ncbi:MAG: hypothetical protein FWG10_00230 [Eubacteriaceae bacterium]|nr:hypothetical protein [Eubacteriaceae bacterium]
MQKNVQKMIISGLLIAIGLIIPMFSPVKIVLGPASYTLASHVAIFIGMLISPSVAIAVAIGTTIGFFFGGFAIVIVLRAASHLIFAVIGSYYIHKVTIDALTPIKARIFSFFIGLIHGAAEVAVVSTFFFGGSLSPAYAERGFFVSVILLVGIGTVIHSMVDFEFAWIIQRLLRKQKFLQID